MHREAQEQIRGKVASLRRVLNQFLLLANWSVASPLRQEFG